MASDTAASVPAEGTWNQVFAEDAARSIDRNTTAACRVYWGSHGCVLTRGHAGHHRCDCCECPNDQHTAQPDAEGVVCVATHPYYGPETNFYGEDAHA